MIDKIYQQTMSAAAPEKSKQPRSLETGDENDPLNYTQNLKCYYWGCRQNE